ncbi:unnamed protein product [Caenorhabditis bovis]|uniref:VWFA domain-containing protein n=1 Tax=Caenorhabditis bovis TaxID=2654633 RepID=A0A8S1EKD7_9PELO|nr:unnamed protein product [Caenorhabditis bovis]
MLRVLLFVLLSKGFNARPTDGIQDYELLSYTPIMSSMSVDPIEEIDEVKPLVGPPKCVEDDIASIDFPAFERNFSLRLQKVCQAASDEEEFLSRGEFVQVDGINKSTIYFQGYIEGEANSTVDGTIVNGVFQGIIITECHDKYIIERLTTSINGAHSLIYHGLSKKQIMATLFGESSGYLPTEVINENTEEGSGDYQWPQMFHDLGRVHIASFIVGIVGLIVGTIGIILAIVYGTASNSCPTCPTVPTTECNSRLFSVMAKVKNETVTWQNSLNDPTSDYFKNASNIVATSLQNTLNSNLNSPSGRYARFDATNSIDQNNAQVVITRFGKSENGKVIASGLGGIISTNSEFPTVNNVTDAMASDKMFDNPKASNNPYDFCNNDSCQSTTIIIPTSSLPPSSTSTVENTTKSKTTTVAYTTTPTASQKLSSTSQQPTTTTSGGSSSTTASSSVYTSTTTPSTTTTTIPSSTTTIQTTSTHLSSEATTTSSPPASSTVSTTVSTTVPTSEPTTSDTTIPSSTTSPFGSSSTPTKVDTTTTIGTTVATETTTTTKSSSSPAFSTSSPSATSTTVPSTSPTVPVTDVSKRCPNEELVYDGNIAVVFELESTSNPEILDFVENYALNSQYYGLGKDAISSERATLATTIPFPSTLYYSPSPYGSVENTDEVKSDVEKYASNISEPIGSLENALIYIEDKKWTGVLSLIIVGNNDSLVDQTSISTASELKMKGAKIYTVTFGATKYKQVSSGEDYQFVITKDVNKQTVADQIGLKISRYSNKYFCPNCEQKTTTVAYTTTPTTSQKLSSTSQQPTTTTSGGSSSTTASSSVYTSTTTPSTTTTTIPSSTTTIQTPTTSEATTTNTPSASSTVSTTVSTTVPTSEPTSPLLTKSTSDTTSPSSTTTIQTTSTHLSSEATTTSSPPASSTVSTTVLTTSAFGSSSTPTTTANCEWVCVSNTPQVSITASTLKSTQSITSTSPFGSSSTPTKVDTTTTIGTSVASETTTATRSSSSPASSTSSPSATSTTVPSTSPTVPVTDVSKRCPNEELVYDGNIAEILDFVENYALNSQYYGLGKDAISSERATLATTIPFPSTTNYTIDSYGKIQNQDDLRTQVENFKANIAQPNNFLSATLSYISNSMMVTPLSLVIVGENETLVDGFSQGIAQNLKDSGVKIFTVGSSKYGSISSADDNSKLFCPISIVTSTTSMSSTSMSTKVSTKPTPKPSTTINPCFCDGRWVYSGDLAIVFEYIDNDQNQAIVNFIENHLIADTNEYELAKDSSGDQPTMATIVPYPNSSDYIIGSYGSISSNDLIKTQIDSFALHRSSNPDPSINDGLSYISQNLTAKSATKAVILVANSDSDVEKAVSTANSLKNQGFIVFTVSVGSSSANFSSLATVSISPVCVSDGSSTRNPITHCPTTSAPTKSSPLVQSTTSYSSRTPESTTAFPTETTSSMSSTVNTTPSKISPSSTQFAATITEIPTSSASAQTTAETSGPFNGTIALAYELIGNQDVYDFVENHFYNSDKYQFGSITKAINVPYPSTDNYNIGSYNDFKSKEDLTENLENEIEMAQINTSPDIIE